MPRHPVRDSHFAFEGPVTTQLMDAFARDWEFVTGESLDGAAWFPALAPARPCGGARRHLGP